MPVLPASTSSAEAAGLVAAWLGGASAALLLKLSSSIDDVVWLAPFLTKNITRRERLQHATTYIGVCLMQTLLAMAIAFSGDFLAGLFTKSSGWSTQKILTVGAGVLMAVYSAKLACEDFQDCRQAGEEEEGEAREVSSPSAGRDNKAPASSPGLSPEGSLEDAAQSLDIPAEAEQGQPEGRQRGLFMIAFLGSVDDLALFVPMLVGQSFDITQLVAGSFAAATAIVCLCLCLGQCSLVANCLDKIPLSAIVVTFAAILLIKGFTSTE